MVSKTPKNNRASIKHAWLNIDKARAICGIDNEMAAFRAITAEEEASTAIIRELKAIGYKNSKLLKPWNHNHKSGIWHLLTVVSAFMHDSGASNIMRFKVSEGVGELKGKLILSFPSLIPNDSRWVNPMPPLNMSITNEGKQVAFQKQSKELANINSANKLLKLIESEANIRNQLIYASPEGIPFVEDPPLGFIEEREKRVMVLTYTYLLISQYRETQLFVQQCLDAYLMMLQTGESTHMHTTL
jgi:hypothetical protein